MVSNKIYKKSHRNSKLKSSINQSIQLIGILVANLRILHKKSVQAQYCKKISTLTNQIGANNLLKIAIIKIKDKI
jgi:hypothetical protein